MTLKQIILLDNKYGCQKKGIISYNCIGKTHLFKNKIEHVVTDNANAGGTFKYKKIKWYKDCDNIKHILKFLNYYDIGKHEYFAIIENNFFKRRTKIIKINLYLLLQWFRNWHFDSIKISYFKFKNSDEQ